MINVTIRFITTIRNACSLILLSSCTCECT